VILPGRLIEQQKIGHVQNRRLGEIPADVSTGFSSDRSMQKSDCSMHRRGRSKLRGGHSGLLAGNTHGGQIRIPLLWPSFVPPRYGARFAYGHVVESGRHMIVSGGLGTSCVPLRLGVPPEIVHIDIGA